MLWIKKVVCLWDVGTWCAYLDQSTSLIAFSFSLSIFNIWVQRNLPFQLPPTKYFIQMYVCNVNLKLHKIVCYIYFPLPHIIWIPMTFHWWHFDTGILKFTISASTQSIFFQIYVFNVHSELHLMCMLHILPTSPHNLNCHAISMVAFWHRNFVLHWPKNVVLKYQLKSEIPNLLVSMWSNICWPTVCDVPTSFHSWQNVRLLTALNKKYFITIMPSNCHYCNLCCPSIVFLKFRCKIMPEK